MSKIAVIQRFLPSRSRGGVGYFTHGLCNALQKRGHQVTVFSQDPTPQDALYHGVVLIAGHGIHAKIAPFLFPFQVAKQDFSAFDIIHAQGDEHLMPREGMPPIIRTMHGSALQEAFHNGLLCFSPKRFLMHMYFYTCEVIADLRADAIVTVSEDTRRFYPKVHAVIPNGVDVELFLKPLIPRTSYPTILFVGEMHNRKRGHLLLEVFRSKIKPLLPDSELWLVCPERGEGEGVRWFGSVSFQELLQLYKQAWIFCLPSSYEGFGRPYIEAMAAGTPVVATWNSGAREVLDEGKYGFLVSDNQLGEILCMLLLNEDLRREYAERGTERVKNYSWEKVAEQYESLYEKLIQERRTNRHSL